MAEILSDRNGGPADASAEASASGTPFAVGDRAEVVFYTSEGDEMVYQGVVQESHTTQVVKINHEWFLADAAGNYSRLPSITNKGAPAIARRTDVPATGSDSEKAAQGARQRRNMPRVVASEPASDDSWKTRQPHPRRSGARGSSR